MIKSPVRRPEVAYLGGAVIAGVAVGHLIKRTVPIGREIERSVAIAIFTDLGSPISGSVGPLLRLAVFTDYRCPACRCAFPAMEEAVRVDGGVRTIYKDWPIFGSLSERVARIALASAK